MLQIAKQGGKNNDDSCGVCAPLVCTTMLQKNLNVMFNVMRYLHDVQSKTPYCVMLCEKKDILNCKPFFRASRAVKAQNKYVCISFIFS